MNSYPKFSNYHKLTRDELILRIELLEKFNRLLCSEGQGEGIIYSLHMQNLELQAQNETLRKAQQELERSRDRYAQLYDYSPVAYLSLDKNGCIIELNLKAAALLGKERHQLRGWPLTPFLSSGQNPLLFDHLAKLWETGESSGVELSIVSSWGMTSCYRLETALMFERDDQPQYCVGVLMECLC